MIQIATIRDSDISNLGEPKSADAPEVRRAARAVVLDNDGAVALLHVTKHGYHKLPGGGLENDEDIAEALARELQEEIGCSANVSAELGRVDEYRDAWNFHQISFCFVAQVVGSKGTPQFTEEELAEGFVIKWAKSIDHAIEILEKDTPESYEGQFIRLRDLAILRCAKNRTYILDKPNR